MIDLLAAHGQLCKALLWLLLRLAVAVDVHERRVNRVGRRLRGSMRRVYEKWLGVKHLLEPRHCARRRPAWNRTSQQLEEKLVRLHVELPNLGAGQLARLVEHVLGFKAARPRFAISELSEDAGVIAKVSTWMEKFVQRFFIGD